MRTLFRLVLVAVAIFSFTAPGLITDSHAAVKAYKPIGKAYKPIGK